MAIIIREIKATLFISLIFLIHINFKTGRKMDKKIKWLLIFLLFSGNIAIADELRLRNGDRITGQLLELSDTLCIFQTAYQAKLHINRSDILHLNTSQPVTVNLNSGERLVGTLTSTENGNFSLHSQRVGTLTSNMAEIISIIGSDNVDVSVINTQLSQVQGKGTEDASKSSVSQEKSNTPETIGEQPDEDCANFFCVNPQSC
ncbi:MAG: hypothetical protein HC887_06420 [Desulfobacteraceae bacterium]|nr:hypothetical protein [Desulfobacteraceae bacterium]